MFFDFGQGDRIEAKLGAVLNVLHFILKKDSQMDAKIQSAIDQIHETKTIEQASAAALQLLSQQTADLKAKIEELTAAGTVSQDDLAALGAAVTELHDSSVALQTATPANTTPPPTA